ncbi:hypothetical protein COL516b_006817 [Colletotrichum fioriniae]|nr:uncharacterized protein COL516b_006817 [Colletotrichum fioriniae]KAJ0302780.1 hypothetical protein COL516b_006817 [Colletotrichum fioriniae]
MGSIPASSSLLLELAEATLASAKRLNEGLAAEGLQQPSFAADGPVYVVPKTASKETQDAKTAVAEVAFQLFQLVTGPSELLPNITASWLYQFNVLSHVPLEGTVTYDTLASKAQVPESLLKGVARMVMTSKILAEPKPGHVTHTASSAMFHKVPNMRDWAGYMFSASIPTAAAMIGGSTGHASYAVAAAYDHLSFEVQDLGAVVNGKETTKVADASGSIGRVSFKAHSFFETQPTTGAAVYMLRMIIHDWPDSEATSILSNLVPALKAGKSTLLIMDTVLPSPGVLPSVRERVIRTRDLTMRQVFNARERDLDDWKALLRATDPRLELKSVKQPEGSNMSLLAIGLNPSS